MFRIVRVLCCTLLVVCLSFIPALCSAEQLYQITETELEQLDRNLTELRNINDRQRTELTLEGQEQSLQNANRLLQQYEAEERSRLRRSRWQRNIAYVIAAAAVFFAVHRS